MIEGLKGDELVKKVGGAFRLAALIQRRLKELIEGSRPLVESAGMTPLEIVVQEIKEDKIAVDYQKTEDLTPPDTSTVSTDLHSAATRSDSPKGALRHGDTGGLTT
ncbi:MAG: DNA-directed RNA polymerase subunit omega [Sedimentisphaerales bacterium]|nr:DNA-directed RNA polymerase subunit omega [Sedimentisphaerales bacterium]